MTKCYAYLRVSGKSQTEGDGFPRQLQAVIEYASAHGMVVERVFEEKAVPGATEWQNRPAFVELMAALHASGTRLVLVEKLDRLARDLIVQETILAELRKSGFELISVAEPDAISDEPSRKLIRQILGSFYEFEKTQIVAKLRAARMRKKAADGRCEGRKPYGGGKNGAIEQKVLEAIKELRDSGRSYPEIASKLNEHKIPSSNGRRWHTTSVYRILKAAEPIAMAA